jgi:hypothetical protein
MKNVHVMLAFLLMPGIAFSQLDPVWGAKAGPTLRTGFIGGDDKDDESASLIVGFHIGGVVEFALSDQVTFQTGLNIISKGLKINYTGNDYSKLSPVYLEIPLLILVPVSDYRIGGGLFIGTGLGGQLEEDGASEDLEFGNKLGDDWSSGDAGICLMASRTVGPVDVGAAVEISLTNSIPKAWRDNGYDYNIHNFNINLFALYFFQ